jgi:5-methylcytosine-specific restriction endonuclease McrA
MKNLRRLAVPPTYISYLVSIREAKRIAIADRGTTADHKLILTNVEAKIEARYEEFNDAVDNRTLENLSKSVAMRAIGSSLRSCYDNDTKAIRELKTAIADAQDIRVLKYCPLCGTTLVATHDHHLPASLFPEFAVHPLNLVPCCSTCNSIKGDDWLDEDGNRLYIHAYSDLLPVEVFLQVDLKTSAATTGVGAVFSITRPYRFSKSAWAVIESHFERLNLIARYTDLSNDEIAEILADCKIYLGAGGTRVKRFLKQRAAERSIIYGASHWQAVLMEKLATSSRLDGWISIVKN